MSQPTASDSKAETLDRQLRRMWTLLEQGTPKHLHSTLRRLVTGAKPAA